MNVLGEVGVYAVTICLNWLYPPLTFDSWFLTTSKQNASCIGQFLIVFAVSLAAQQ